MSVRCFRKTIDENKKDEVKCERRRKQEKHPAGIQHYMQIRTGKEGQQWHAPIPSTRPSTRRATWVNEKVAVVFYCLKSEWEEG